MKKLLASMLTLTITLMLALAACGTEPVASGASGGAPRATTYTPQDTTSAPPVTDPPVYDTSFSNIETSMNEYGLPGRVRVSRYASVFFGGQEFELIENWYHGEVMYHEFCEIRGGGLSVSGMPVQANDIADFLNVVPYHDDFRINFSAELGQPDENINFRLYDSSFTELYHKNEFTPPTEAGEYILEFSTWFYTEDDEGVHGSAFQFFMKFVL
jgi:hypothetical protein